MAPDFDATMRKFICINANGAVAVSNRTIRNCLAEIVGRFFINA
jgi:hypothetical protein